MTTDQQHDWVPESCTLPTPEQPFRVAEFDQLFAHVTRIEQAAATALRLDLEPTADVAATAASLAMRESACCGFFAFTLTASTGSLRLGIDVADGHAAVLDGFAQRAMALSGAGVTA